MDNVSREKRSIIMRAVGSKNTGPELALRQRLHQRGYRYRLHVSTLPGTPDLVFPARRKVIFVHGCFWHGHYGCSKAGIPKYNTEYWNNKILTNMKRDTKNIALLYEMGWRVLIVWQCNLRKIYECLEAVTNFLEKK